MTGLSLREAIKIKAEEEGNGNDYVIKREPSVIGKYYLLPVRRSSKGLSVWDILLKGKRDEGEELNRDSAEV